MSRSTGMSRSAGGDELHRLVEGRLRRVGQRYTSQRRALVDALRGAGKPRSIPELLATSAVPQSSAYRNLTVLEHAGAVRRVATDEDHNHFELAEVLTEHHHHLICRSCGRVDDVTLPTAVERQVDRTLDRVARRAGFAEVAHRLDLIGTCAECASTFTA